MAEVLLENDRIPAEIYREKEVKQRTLAGIVFLGSLAVIGKEGSFGLEKDEALLFGFVAFIAFLILNFSHPKEK